MLFHSMRRKVSDLKKMTRIDIDSQEKGEERGGIERVGGIRRSRNADFVRESLFSKLSKDGVLN